MSFDNMADGEVRNGDRENKKMTINHGELKNLDMPRMTMVFPIRNATLLETFKASDKVKFVANKLDGVFFVTDIQLAK
jgi:Cu/Ag efflux protein CusF